MPKSKHRLLLARDAAGRWRDARTGRYAPAPSRLPRRWRDSAGRWRDARGHYASPPRGAAPTPKQKPKTKPKPKPTPKPKREQRPRAIALEVLVAGAGRLDGAGRRVADAVVATLSRWGRQLHLRLTDSQRWRRTWAPTRRAPTAKRQRGRWTLDPYAVVDLLARLAPELAAPPGARLVWVAQAPDGRWWPLAYTSQGAADSAAEAQLRMAELRHRYMTREK